VQRPEVQTAATQAIDKPQQMPEQKRAKASDAMPLGGFISRADTATTAEQAAPAATSPGVVRAYATAVAEALDRTKPKRVPGYGTLKVEVKLVISIDGEIASLEILRSSGNRRTDDTVLAAVRRTKLPVPPPGLSLKERWFEFEYTFDPKRS
jgi:TonB family protein